ncbi:MAG TPA: hypothetical protein VF897_06470 [Roseiflexaceae bacterium]
MTTQSDFSREEWELLGNAPLAASAAVSVASPGGGGREATALIAGWRAGGRLFPHSELLQAVVAGLDPQDREAQERSAGLRSRGPQPTFDDIVDEAVDLCSRAIDLLEQVATPQETADYQAFVMYVATEVANATGEGGFMGMGGERVSRAERAVLRELAEALRYRPS